MRQRWPQCTSRHGKQPVQGRCLPTIRLGCRTPWNAGPKVWQVRLLDSREMTHLVAEDDTSGQLDGFVEFGVP